MRKTLGRGLMLALLLAFALRAALAEGAGTDGVFTLPDALTTVGAGAFENTAAREIVLPSTVTTIEDYAFARCEGLERVVVPASVEEIGPQAFEGAGGVVIITEPGAAAALYARANGLPAMAEGGALLSGATDADGAAVFPEGVIVIYEGAFSGSAGLTHAAIPESVQYIAPNAFANCESLERVTVPDTLQSISTTAFSGSHQVTVIANEGSMAAQNCRANYIPAMSPDGMVLGLGVDADGAAVFPRGATAIPDSLYTGRAGFKTMVIPGTVRTIGSQAFLSCYNLRSLTLEEGVETIGQQAFCACQALAELELPGSLRTIGTRAFTACPMIVSLEIPEGVETIGDYAFSPCANLIEVSLPSTLRTLGDDAFMGCGYLERVNLPDDLEQIGSDVFAGDGKLWAVANPGTRTAQNLFNGFGNVRTPDNRVLCVAHASDAFNLDGSFDLPANAFAAMPDREAPWTIYLPEQPFAIDPHAFDDLNVEKLVAPANGAYTAAWAVGLGVNAFDDAGWCYYLNDADWTVVDGIVTAYRGEDPIMSVPAFATGIAAGAVARPETVRFLCLPESVATVEDGGLAPEWAFVHSEALAELFEGRGSRTRVLAEGISPALDEDGLFIVEDTLYLYRGSAGEVTLPRSVEHIAADAFRGNAALTSVYVNAYVLEVGDRAFMDCAGLATLEGANDSLALTGVGERAFMGCEQLSRVDLSRVTAIGESAFENAGLTAAELSEVHFVGARAFYGSRLESVRAELYGALGDQAFGACGDLKSVEIQLHGADCRLGAYLFDGLLWVDEIGVFGGYEALDQLLDENALRSRHGDWVDPVTEQTRPAGEDDLLGRVVAGTEALYDYCAARGILAELRLPAT